MNEHRYVIEDIDASWHCLLTVADTAERIAKLDAKARLVDRHDGSFSLETFIELHEQAKDAAMQAGWTGVEGDARVFWIPVESDVSYGFAFIDDSRALVYSPVALPHVNVVDPIED